MPPAAADRRMWLGCVLLAVATGLAVAMTVAGMTAAAVLEPVLARTSNVYVDWHLAQRINIGLDVMATAVLALATAVALIVIAQSGGWRRRGIAGLIAVVLMAVCAAPTAGWFRLVWLDMRGPDREFTMSTYGYWYFPLVTALGLGYVLTVLTAAAVLARPQRSAATPAR